MYKVEINCDLRRVKGIGESLCGMLGIEMERKYLRLSGDYQGEGTHTLLEIGNVKLPYSAGDLPKWNICDPWGE